MKTPKAKAKRKPKPVVRTVRSVAVLIRWRRGQYSLESFPSIERAVAWCRQCEIRPIVAGTQEPT